MQSQGMQAQKSNSSRGYDHKAYMLSSALGNFVTFCLKFKNKQKDIWFWLQLSGRVFAWYAQITPSHCKRKLSEKNEHHIKMHNMTHLSKNVYILKCIYLYRQLMCTQRNRLNCTRIHLYLRQLNYTNRAASMSNRKLQGCS